MKSVRRQRLVLCDLERSVRNEIHLLSPSGAKTLPSGRSIKQSVTARMLELCKLSPPILKMALCIYVYPFALDRNISTANGFQLQFISLTSESCLSISLNTVLQALLGFFRGKKILFAMKDGARDVTGRVHGTMLQYHNL